MCSDCYCICISDMYFPSSLTSHLSPNGTECYISSDLFYLEVHLDPEGQLSDVKVAHQGESPMVSVSVKGKYS